MFIVADFNYIETINGWIYTAFIIHMLGCSIVGWKVSNDMNKNMVFDALEQALVNCNKLKALTHDNDSKV
ncbi:hypothetical protein CXF56_11160 [Psychrobacter sp. Choline-02u-13]|uniref:hypothetical protein n=1 Tax=unclassified Psychrobacter TaxID=196806 RepID=UPI000C7BE898|nr:MULTISPECIES: hypothetical protein [unclassified Psychrobacter]PKG63592.1 hypothetical protein CXF56_11160 [Psychrobacter sp. Choline-02u-13]PKH53180.1 hypothetical protein CXF69_08710 [Psychrobacter sp. Choline-02u-9]